MQYKLKVLVLLFFQFFKISCVDMYFCTAADSAYFDRLMNLVGSIHKTNFENLKEIAVFDLGFNQNEIRELKKIQKLNIYNVELTHSDILKPFKINNFRAVKGWYSWKPVVIKQALDINPYVLWIDAGTTVLTDLSNLFKYINQNGYFLLTIGDDIKNNGFVHNVRWQTTKYILEKFHINTAHKQWILNQEALAATFIGVTKKNIDEFILPMYKLANDLRNYEDDGSTPEGFGYARYEQAILTILAYTKGLKILKQYHKQECPMYLDINNEQIPFYITWNSNFVDHRTNIYHSRMDLSNYKEFLKYIKYK